MFPDFGSKNQLVFSLQVNCIRLIDAAISDYSLGRKAIQSFHGRRPDQFGIEYISLSTTHFESCIWHLERFIKHVKLLRSLKIVEPSLKDRIPKKPSFLSNDAEKKITTLRHTLAHLEKSLNSGEIPQGKSIALMPQETGLVIGEHIIKWEDLVQWLNDSHSCAVMIATFRSQAPSSGT